MTMTLTGSELIVVYPLPPLTTYEATPTGFPVLTPEIITISELVVAGGGGYSKQFIVNSGTVYTVTDLNSFVGWNSSSTSPKTLNIPASVGSLGMITISDVAGTASAYPITVVPGSGGIVGAQNQVYIDYMTMTLLDTNAGWVQL